jgi:hypothetical protein
MRSIYSAQYFGIDVFEKHCKITQEKIGTKLGKKKHSNSNSISILFCYQLFLNKQKKA